MLVMLSQVQPPACPTRNIRQRTATATTGHNGMDGQRTDDYDGTDDGTDGQRTTTSTTGRTDGQRTTTATTGRTRRDGPTDDIYIYIYIFPKFPTRHWDQYSNVKVN